MLFSEYVTKIFMNTVHYHRIEKAIDYISKNYKNQPSLSDVAREVHMSPFHLQKMFKAWVGISPKKFLEVLTLEHIKSVLEETNSLTKSTYEAGLSSTSRTFDLFVNIEAITPSEYKKRGENLVINYGIHKSLFGDYLLAVTKKGICALHFLDSENREVILDESKQKWKNAKFIYNPESTKVYADKLFQKDYRNHSPIQIFLKGTNFQIQVWKALLEIPAGKLTTYENIAKKVGAPKALRAVGSAIGSNPISYIIPCHRVIRKNGVLGNYRWGIPRKSAMVVWEGSDSLEN
jgi:AraC family transcriptional regulator of adaptative response/methylated-DNA-[protein]-cysteine methyltransferase